MKSNYFPILVIFFSSLVIINCKKEKTQNSCCNEISENAKTHFEKDAKWLALNYLLNDSTSIYPTDFIEIPSDLQNIILNGLGRIYDSQIEGIHHIIDSTNFHFSPNYQEGAIFIRINQNNSSWFDNQIIGEPLTETGISKLDSLMKKYDFIAYTSIGNLAFIIKTQHLINIFPIMAELEKFDQVIYTNTNNVTYNYQDEPIILLKIMGSDLEFTLSDCSSCGMFGHPTARHNYKFLVKKETCDIILIEEYFGVP